MESFVAGVAVAEEAQGPFSALSPRLRQRALALLQHLGEVLALLPHDAPAWDGERRGNALALRLGRLEFSYSFVPMPGYVRIEGIAEAPLAAAS